MFFDDILRFMFRINTHTITLHGLSIAYTECGDPQGRILFCVHGLLSNGRDYDALELTMAAQGYRVISMDLIGRGRSEWFPDKTHYTLPHYLPFVIGLIAEVTQGKPFDYFGVSLGGMIGMALHKTLRGQMQRLVLVDIGAEIPAQGLDAVSQLAKSPARFQTKEEAECFLKTRCAAWGITRDDVWAHLICHNIVPEGDGWRMHYDPAIGAALPEKNTTISFWPLWKQIRQPVLLIRGGQSNILPTGVAQKMEQTYKGKQFSEIVFEDCGHVPNLMEMEQIIRLKDWLLTSGLDQSGLHKFVGQNIGKLVEFARVVYHRFRKL